jgi:LemA protein
VTKLNTLIRQWPSSFVASMLHFTPSDYIEEDEAKSEMPSINDIFNAGKTNPTNQS